ncbi:MAG: serine/threonine protein kinase [Rubripirellula sp.]
MEQADVTQRINFHQALLTSELVDPERYQAIIRSVGSNDPGEISAALIKQGEITAYQAEQLQLGRTKFRLGPYLITEGIGQGGMGQVFKGVHEVMGRECAVKVLPLEKSTDESRAAFQHEIRLQAGLDSAYLVRAFDAGRDGNVHYLVTEYVPGNDLRRLIRASGPLSVAAAALIIADAARGLQYAHELGMVHRDIKPGNILVTPDGHAKVSDIGLAVWSMSLDADPRAGKIVGTADYLSPEQIRDPASIGPLSDIYSLGCTLYFAVTGKVPFPGGDSKSKCRRHCEQTPWHPRRFTPSLPEEFVDVVADMMEKEAERRIQSAAEVVERLEAWISPLEGVVEIPMERQVWTPPPPPQEPSQLRESLDSNELSLSGGSSVMASGSHSDSSLVPLLPHDDAAHSSSVQGLGPTSPRSGRGVAVAIALAIAVPVSLLIGAVVGFWVREVVG